MKQVFFLLMLAGMFTASASSAQKISIVPMPVSLTPTPGQFMPGNAVSIYSSDAQVTSFLKEYLTSIGIQSADVSSPTKASISLSIIKPDTLLPKGYYSLVVLKNGVHITATEGAGLFYGVQSLIQLFGADKTAIPCVTIIDHPRFEWRGLHLDVSRHFFPVAFVKRYIDLMAHYKFNSFHWHLTDDQGWRIEIKKYPKLQETAAYRKETLIGHYGDVPHRFDGKKYGGYYTQEEIKEVVAYAAKRHITVVPEIEMPGHALAALSAYPNLGCTGGPYDAATLWGVFDDVFCAGKEETFSFLQDVLDEVVTLFPGQYIHVGGDECPKVRWHECERCQKRMKTENLKDEHELQSYFIQRIEKYLNSKGKKIIGWDEILEGGLAPNAAVMSWRGESGGIAAARSKHNVVMSPGFALYFDHYNSTAPGEPVAIGGYTPLRKVYQYDPLPLELSHEESRYILGAQANLWTEYILSPEHAEYMVYPRALALSEVLWTPKYKRSWEDFANRLPLQYTLLDHWKVNYRKPKTGDNDKVADLMIDVKNSSKQSRSQCTVTLFRSSDDFKAKKNAAATATTNENGRVVFRGLEPLTYYILVSTGNTDNFNNPAQSQALSPWDVGYKQVIID
jgi:hexosaminidase